MAKPRFDTRTFEEVLAADPLGEFFIEWDDVHDPDVADLESALSRATSEREMQAYLEENPYLLIQHLGGGHGRYVLPQLRLGSEYVADFVLCERDSLGYHWTLVEIESPRALRGKQTGEATAELNHAINQIQDWRRWVTENVAYARSQLRLKEIDSTAAGLIIMGRRGDGIDPGRLKQALTQNNIEVHSYDWLIDSLRSKLNGPWFGLRNSRPKRENLVYRHFRRKS
jgi:hypothetical protein